MSSGSALNASFVDHEAFFAVFPGLVFFLMIVRSSCVNVWDWEQRKWSAGGQHWGYSSLGCLFPKTRLMDAAWKLQVREVVMWLGCRVRESAKWLSFSVNNYKRGELTRIQYSIFRPRASRDYRWSIHRWVVILIWRWFRDGSPQEVADPAIQDVSTALNRV